MRPLVRGGFRTVVAVLAAVAIVGSLGWMFWFGLRPANWVSERTQWANQQVRASLVAVNEVVRAAGERPNVLVMNYNDVDDPETRANSAYGWAKTYTNVFRTGLPGDVARQSVTYLGTVPNFLAGEETVGASDGYNRASTEHFDELGRRREEFTEDPVVFLIGQYYGGLCNDGACPEDDPATPDVNEKTEAQAANLQAALDAGGAVEVGPDVYVLTGDGLWTPPDDVVAAANARATAEAARFEDHPSAFADPAAHADRAARAPRAGRAARAPRDAFLRRRHRGRARRDRARDVLRDDPALGRSRVLAVWRRPAHDHEGMGGGGGRGRPRRGPRVRGRDDPRAVPRRSRGSSTGSSRSSRRWTSPS